jgi:hypothetical protein
MAAYTAEATAYCKSLGVKTLATPEYFSSDVNDIHAVVQGLLNKGANILYTDSLGSGPTLIARTLAEMGLRNSVVVAVMHSGLDSEVGLLGKDTLGADGLPVVNGIIGSMPRRTWAEIGQPGIQFIAEQADLRQRPFSVHNNAYIWGWEAADLFIELYIRTGNRVGFEHVSGAEIKRTLETLVYSPLGLVTIDYHGGRRALATDRIGQLAFLGRDGKNAAGPNNPPLTVDENGARLPVPIVLPLTDFQPAPDLRPGGADVPAGVKAPTPVATIDLPSPAMPGRGSP